MNIRRRLALVVIGHGLLSCAPGLRPVRCGEARHETARSVYERLERFWADQLPDSPTLICTDNTEIGCRDDVAACTPNPDRIIVSNKVPIDSALAHEALHLILWERDPCHSHAESCGWDDTSVELSLEFVRENADATP